MDVRDLVFWFDHARLKLSTDKLNAIENARLAMTEDSVYKKRVAEIAAEIKNLSLGTAKEKRIATAWDSAMPGDKLTNAV